MSSIFNTGKNPKWKYYVSHGASYFIPDVIYRNRLNKILGKVNQRNDFDEIEKRVNYYNKLSAGTNLSEKDSLLSELKQNKKNIKAVYFYDSYEFTRYFPGHLKCNFLFGDITEIPPVPSVLKSRPIEGDNRNSVLFKLNKVRHFIFLQDRIPFESKEDKVIFRGKVKGKANRRKFMEMYFGSPFCDAADVSRNNTEDPPEWKAPKETLYKHLKYKFIMALEGNDVASNLKWIMSSNSIAVMPKPTYETWFMEGTLIPDFHFIEIKPDFSDLEEKINFYIRNPDKAKQIISNANRYVKQFQDKEKEKIISLLVLQKYFEQTGQLK
jgi:hypothetical protein